MLTSSLLDVPGGDDPALAKRRAIQAVMTNRALSGAQRNRLIRETIKENFSYESCNDDDEDDIFRASREGDVDTVKSLLERDPSLVNGTDENGRIPMHLACAYGQLNAAKHLGRMFSKGDFDQNTPLHEACRHGHDSVVKWILEGHHDPEVKEDVIMARNCRGQIPLHLAAQGGFVAVVQLLYDHGANQGGALKQLDGEKRTPMHYAAQSGSVLAVECILANLVRKKKGVFQLRDGDGRFPLHWACSNERSSLALIELLLSERPDAVAHRDKEGRLPLDIAIEQKLPPKTVDLLRDATAEVGVNTAPELVPELVETASPITPTTIVARSGCVNDKINGEKSGSFVFRRCCHAQNSLLSRPEGVSRNGYYMRLAGAGLLVFAYYYYMNVMRRNEWRS